MFFKTGYGFFCSLKRACHFSTAAQNFSDTDDLDQISSDSYIDFSPSRAELNMFVWKPAQGPVRGALVLCAVSFGALFELKSP
jgi:hypothetical protein